MANELNGSEIKSDDSFYSWINRVAKGVNKENKAESLSIYKNVQTVGIYFAANWLPQSKDYIPVFEKIRKEMKSSKDSEFEMILISCDKNESEMLEFLGSTEVTYPTIPPNNQVKDILKAKFEVSSIPVAVIINVKNFLVIDVLTKTKLNNLYVEQDIKGVCESWLEGKQAHIKGSPSPKGSLNTPVSQANQIQKKAKKLERERSKMDILEKKKQEKLEKDKQRDDDKELKKQAKEELSREKKRQEEERRRLRLEKKKMKHNSSTIDTISVDSTFDLDASTVENTPAHPSEYLPSTEEATPVSPTWNSVRDQETVVSDTSSNYEGKKRFGQAVFGSKSEKGKASSQLELVKLECEKNELLNITCELKIQNERQTVELTTLRAELEKRKSEQEAVNQANSELKQENLEVTTQNETFKESLKSIGEEMYEVKEEVLVLKNEIKELQGNMHLVEEEKYEFEMKYQKLLKSFDINGWMSKRGTKGMTKKFWRSRYFKLGNIEKIHFYKSSNMKTVRGSILVSDIEKVEEIADNSDFLFNISTKQRNFEMKAPDDSTRKNWVEAINFLMECNNKRSEIKKDSSESIDTKMELVNEIDNNETIEVSPTQ